MLEQAGTLRLSRERTVHNIHLFRNRLPAATQLCATVKANAYGHGVGEMTPILAAAGIDWFCVYSIAEALEIADLVAGKPILVLAPLVLPAESTPTPEKLHQLNRLLHRNTIRITLTDPQSVRNLAALMHHLMHHPVHHLQPAAPLPVHIQVDTGLTRQGAALHEAEALCRTVAAQPALRLEGLFAHLSHGDVPSDSASPAQLRAFADLAKRIRTFAPKMLIHAQNTGGAWHWPGEQLDMVRLGIGLYGLQPAIEHPIPGLTPVACLEAPITAIHSRASGTGIGYGHTYILKRNSRLAIVPVGYADGYPRALSNRAHARIHGIQVPVIGRVSMDQSILDVTDAPAALGDTVTLISSDPTSSLCMDSLASLCGTIGYELATGLGQRLHRVVE